MSSKFLTTKLFLLLLLVIHNASSLAEGTQTQSILRLILDPNTRKGQDVNGPRKSVVSQSYATQFPCERLAPSPSVPTSVHALRPGDVNVVAALGDSLTAGRGAEGGISGILKEYRGVSWSIGADGTYATKRTLPDILREYNDKLYGGSTGVGDRNKKDSRLNVAKTGALAKDMPAQAKFLVKRMKKDELIDFENDWKVITLFIGANDLCLSCKDEYKYSAEQYKIRLQDTLDILHEEVPRAFVNLVEVLNVELTRELSENPGCPTIPGFSCGCAVKSKSSSAFEKLIRLREEYQTVARDLAASGRYDTREDFTVVSQPFYRDTNLPRTSSGQVDTSYFAADCFHHSEKAHRAAAKALWNNMVQPVGQKSLEWSPSGELACPSESAPWLFTNKNSQVV